MKQFDNIEQGTDEWHHKRKTAITGTVLKNIMGTSKARQKAIYKMIGDRLAVGIEDENENAMDRGHRLEGEARVAFEFEKNKKVDQTGFAEDDDNPQIANSPDGLINEDEALEIKCPGRQNHVEIWLTNKVPDEYFWQAIQYFIVNKKLKKLWFASYHPEIIVHPLHIIEVTRDQIYKDLDLAAKAEEAFLLEVESILSTIIKI
jgi:putative phage-type endonuclease